MQEQAKTQDMHSIWTFQVTTVDKINGYLLGLPKLISAKNDSIVDLLHMRPNASCQLRPVAFLSEFNAKIYQQEMAELHKNKSILDFQPVSTDVFRRNHNMEVNLMNLTTVTCPKCGRQITKMLDMKHGLFFSTVTTVCGNCGHNVQFKQPKNLKL